jgi:hypothetical protein
MPIVIIMSPNLNGVSLMMMTMMIMINVLSTTVVVLRIVGNFDRIVVWVVTSISPVVPHR